MENATKWGAKCRVRRRRRTLCKEDTADSDSVYLDTDVALRLMHPFGDSFVRSKRL